MSTYTTFFGQKITWKVKIIWRNSTPCMIISNLQKKLIRDPRTIRNRKLTEYFGHTTANC